MEEIQVEPPKSSEVRVKILYASVCHTDLLYTKGFPIVSIHFLPNCYCPIIYFQLVFIELKGLLLIIDLQPLFPRVLGHEGVG